MPHVKFQPDLFELIGVFADGLGCDRVSDMIVSILKPRFIAYTDRITRTLGIQQTLELTLGSQRVLFPQLKRGDKPILFVPKEILKPLPIAMNIEEALMNADLNDQARHEVNKAFADAHRLGRRPSATSLRSIISNDSSVATGILSAYQRMKGIPYNFDTAPQNVADFDPIARELVGRPTIDITNLDPWQRVEACVKHTIDHLRHSFEENRLSDVLFDDKGEKLAVRDLVGGENFQWKGTPLYVLYQKHIKAGKDIQSAIKAAARDLGWLVKTVLSEDKRTFEVGKGGLVSTYRWVGNEP